MRTTGQQTDRSGGVCSSSMRDNQGLAFPAAPRTGAADISRRSIHLLSSSFQVTFPQGGTSVASGRTGYLLRGLADKQLFGLWCRAGGNYSSGKCWYPTPQHYAYLRGNENNSSAVWAVTLGVGLQNSLAPSLLATLQTEQSFPSRLCLVAL